MLKLMPLGVALILSDEIVRLPVTVYSYRGTHSTDILKWHGALLLIFPRSGYVLGC